MKKIYITLTALILLHAFILMSIRFTAWPEMISYPYLLNNGFILYKDFVHPYPPLLTIILSMLYKIFGYNLIILKAFTWAIILSSDILIFKIVRKLSGKPTFAIIALAIYVFTQPMLEGNELWFDLAIVPPVLLGTYFLLSEKTKKSIFFSGLFFGLAALIKQTSGLFLIAGFIYLTLTKNTKKLLSFSSGPFLLAGLMAAYLIFKGILADFINWNIVYPFSFWSKFPGYVQMNLTNGQMFTLGILLFPLFVLVAQNYKAVLKDKAYPILAVFLTISLVMIYPRFSYFHFQLGLVFIVISLGYLMSKFKLSPLVIAMTGTFIFFAITLTGLKRDLGVETRFWSGDDVSFAQRISKQVGMGTVYLLGQPSSLYTFSGKVPPKPWLDNYGWYFEAPGVQANTLDNWKLSPPEFIIWQDPSQGNWYDLGIYQPKDITTWIKNNFARKEEIRKGVWLWQKKD